jgi:hypothetical protein
MVLANAGASAGAVAVRAMIVSASAAGSGGVISRNARINTHIASNPA